MTKKIFNNEKHKRLTNGGLFYILVALIHKISLGLGYAVWNKWQKQSETKRAERWSGPLGSLSSAILFISFPQPQSLVPGYTKCSRS